MASVIKTVRRSEPRVASGARYFTGHRMRSQRGLMTRAQCYMPRCAGEGCRRCGGLRWWQFLVRTYSAVRFLPVLQTSKWLPKKMLTYRIRAAVLPCVACLLVLSSQRARLCGPVQPTGWCTRCWLPFSCALTTAPFVLTEECWIRVDKAVAECRLSSALANVLQLDNTSGIGGDRCGGLR